ncbi:glycosyltransferase [Clostridium sp. FP2]|uniref:glycosyltransferase family 2 protein n=1 Tax=Clostridium sp. FP2 TaxID=2724481 RepID=UPI0013E95940|nr:glycosyltransferase family 2 protein [Clostridium sp. FP2]MBZ9622599.1 glycosyltransferase [Clostridium sp. FP2]
MEQPLVSILIPAYNKPQFLKIALESVLSQTYANLEIIICDDSSNDGVQKMIVPYLAKYPQIQYFNNGGPLGQYGINNGNKCLKLSTGDYINFLMDDDIFYPTKIETMMKYFQDDEVTMVTSQRNRIDGDGKLLPEIAATKSITTIVRKFDGIELGRTMLLKKRNFIGEPTTVLFKKKYIEGFGLFMGRQYLCNVDIAMWLSLLSNGKCVYIPETLSSFRIHDNFQKTFDKNIRKLGKEELNYLLMDGKKSGFI